LAKELNNHIRKMYRAGRFYIGTSGIVVPVSQTEYPDEFKGKSRLSYYSSVLNSLEVNSSFYRNPRITTIIKWTGEVGENFRFTFKIPKLISHVKDLKFDMNVLSEFLNLINNAGKKKGCILIQLPPSVKADLLPELIKLLQEISNKDKVADWNIAVEFRHPSWYISKVEKALSKYNSCIVIHDHPKAPTPLDFESAFFYIRFHGEGGRYRGSYETSALESYASKARQWLDEGKTGYAYFNNTMGEAYENALTLSQLTL
jgi:uncharacterized protein YecE (DUF72 family)